MHRAVHMKYMTLKNLSLEIHDGEFVGIIGHTGSGKSTLIQLLDGLIKADEGHIYMTGRYLCTGLFSAIPAGTCRSGVSISGVSAF